MGTRSIARPLATYVILTFAWFWGCIALARAKDRPWYLGLLGLFSFLGVAVLWYAVPDGQNVQKVPKP